jgi:hypothetical protein
MVNKFANYEKTDVRNLLKPPRSPKNAKVYEAFL